MIPRIVFVGAAFFSSLMPVSASSEVPSGPSSVVQIAGPVLIVGDLERSLRFYTRGLGMAVGSRLPGNPGPGATVVGQSRGAWPFVLLRQRESKARASLPADVTQSLSRIMLIVSDPVVLFARLKVEGYKPTDPGASRIFFVKDPDGYNYEVMPMRGH